MYEISKSDWKKYREKIGSWQENYMERSGGIKNEGLYEI